MRRLLVVLAALAAAGLAPAAHASDLAPTTVCPTTSSTQMWCLHNFARAQHGLPALARPSIMYRAAAIKADKIEECGTFTHGPCGLPWTFNFTQAGWTGQTVGENIAYGYPTIRSVFQGWLNSPGHLANILNPSFNCYGSAFRPTGVMPRLWVIDFCRAAPASFEKTWDGRGVFVVDSEAFDPETWAGEAIAHGYTWVAVLCADGLTLQNQRNIRAWTQIARKAGLKVGLWAVNRTQPVLEAQLHARLIEDLGADFFIANPEAEYKTDVGGVRERAKQYTDAFTSTVPHGVVTYGAGWGLLTAVMDFTPWQRKGWQFLPEAYENEDPVYELGRVMEQAVLTGWPRERVTPVVATYVGRLGRVDGFEWRRRLTAVGVWGFGVYPAEDTPFREW